MSASFARRIAPGVLLGTAAVGIVAMFDPALHGGSDAVLAAGSDVSGGGLSTTGITADGAAPNSNTTAANGSQGGSGSGGSANGNGSNSGSSNATNSGSNGSNSGNSGGKSSGGGGSADCSTGQTVTGSTVQTRYGPVQVEATVANGQLCAVQTLQYPNGDGRSSYISSKVIPWLDSHEPQIGVDFQHVTGATYTSEGYRQSLQSVLDQI